MQPARLAQAPPSKKPHVILFLCALTALLVPAAAAAQSGRRVPNKVSPVQSDPVRPDKPAPRVTTVVVCGHDASREMKELVSNNVSITVKAITAALNERRGLLIGVLNGGKQTQLEAVARARREAGAYVLWFGYRMKTVGLSDETVEHIDYVVYKPGTAEVLTEGRVLPGEEKEFADPRGITRLPGARVRARPTVLQQLKAGGREIADRVRNKL